jgi:hypothetical protein
MSSKTRFAFAGGAAVAAATLLVAVPSAGAAPSGGEFTVTCPGEDPFTVTTPSGQPFTPAFIEGTEQLLIPYRITGEILAPGEEPVPINDVKRAPVPENAITCTFVGNFGDVTVTGTVVAVVRGH